MRFQKVPFPRLKRLEGIGRKVQSPPGFRWEPDSCEIRGEVSVQSRTKGTCYCPHCLCCSIGKMSFFKIKIKEEQEVEPCFAKHHMLLCKITVAERVPLPLLSFPAQPDRRQEREEQFCYRCFGGERKAARC